MAWLGKASATGLCGALQAIGSSINLCPKLCIEAVFLCNECAHRVKTIFFTNQLLLVKNSIKYAVKKRVSICMSNITIVLNPVLSAVTRTSLSLWKVTWSL